MKGRASIPGQPEEPPTLVRPRASRKRVHRRLKLALVLMPALYLAGLNGLLNSGALPRLVSKRPEKLSMKYATAWALWPGTLYVYGLTLVVRSPKESMTIQLARARVEIDLASLGHRHFHARNVEGSGFRFRARRRPKPPATKLENGQKTKRPRKPPWRVTIDELGSSVEEIDIHRVRYHGPGHLSASFALRARREIRGHLEVEFHGGVVDVGSIRVLERAKGRADGQLHPLIPEKNKGFRILKNIDLAIQGGAKVRDLAFLRYILSRAPWLRFSGGEGGLTGNVTIKRGLLRLGSRFEFEGNRIIARFSKYRASGSGTIRWAVRESKSGPAAELDVRLKSYELDYSEFSKPHVRGKNLRISTSTPDIDLSQGRFQRLSVKIDIPAARVPDMSVYNIYIPKELGLRIRSGAGRLDMYARLNEPRVIERFDSKLQGRDLRATFDGIELTGQLTIETRQGTGDLEKNEFRLVDTRIEISDVSVVEKQTAPNQKGKAKSHTQGWWARFRFPETLLSTRKNRLLASSLQAEIRDTKPLILFLTRQQKLPSLLKKILQRKNLKVTGRITVGEDLLELDDLAIDTKWLKILARIRLLGSKQWAVLYAKYLGTTVGIERREGETRIRPFKTRKWYREYPSFGPLPD